MLSPYNQYLYWTCDRKNYWHWSHWSCRCLDVISLTRPQWLPDILRCFSTWPYFSWSCSCPGIACIWPMLRCIQRLHLGRKWERVLGRARWTWKWHWNTQDWHPSINSWCQNTMGFCVLHDSSTLPPSAGNYRVPFDSGYWYTPTPANRCFLGTPKWQGPEEVQNILDGMDSSARLWGNSQGVPARLLSYSPSVEFYL